MQLRDYLPKTLYGRMLSIILLPMILVQVITVFIFYERHWDTVTRHMAQNLAGEMALVIDQAGTAPECCRCQGHYRNWVGLFQLSGEFRQRRILGTPMNVTNPSYAETMLRREIGRRISHPWQVNTASDPNLIFVDVQLETGVLRIYASRKRIFSSTSWTFFGWTVGSSDFVICSSAGVFTGQIRPIHRLAMPRVSFWHWACSTRLPA